MSLSLDDKSMISNNAGFKAGGNKRNASRNAGSVNPESPRTIEACMELGISPEDLKQKPPQAFYDANLEEEIVKLRYEHYLNRYNQTVKDVVARRKEMIKHKHHYPQQGDAVMSMSPAKSPGKNSRGFSFTNLNTSQNNETRHNASQHNPHAMRSSLTLNNSTLVPANLLANYNKTVSYLRNSHGSPETKNPHDLNLYDDEESKPFDNQLAHEIEKFNFLKKMKQREAIRTYEEDLKRIKMIVDINERKKRKEELEKKMKDESEKARTEQRKKNEEKMKSIKDKERYYNEQRRKEEDKLKNKLEGKKQKIRDELEEKLRAVQENEQRLQEKKRRADEVREQRERQNIEEIEILNQKIQDKMFESQEKHESVLNDKVEYIRNKMDNLTEKMIQIKEKRVQKEEEFIHELVDKVKEKERRNMEFDKKREQEYKERMARLKSKDDMFKGNSKKLKGDEKQRINELQDRQKHAEERIELKKQEEQKQIKLKQELRRLKMVDNQENYERKRRMLEYEQERILERERFMAEKLQALKVQKEIIQKAKLEGSLQVKLERERIADAISSMSKKIRLRGDEDLDGPTIEEKKLDGAQQPQPVNPADPQQVPLSKVNGNLKRIHEKGMKLLQNVVQLEDDDMKTIENIISGHPKTTKSSSQSPSKNASLHYR